MSPRQAKLAQLDRARDRAAQVVTLRLAKVGGKRIAALVGVSRSRVAQIITAARKRGVRFPSLKRADLLFHVPARGEWSAGDLASALVTPVATEHTPFNPWVALAQRLAFQYGEAEALKRINGYASERVAA